MPLLRFLADESCGFGVVRVLREHGYDVLAVSEITTRSVDRELIDQAYQENRILITEDKDFGWFCGTPGQYRSPQSGRNGAPFPESCGPVMTAR